MYGLIGSFGAGKSTLLRCINGLEEFKSGTIHVKNLNLNELKGAKKKLLQKNIGFILPQISFINRKTIFENVALPMRCWRVKPAVIDKKVNRMLELVGLKSEANNRVDNLGLEGQHRLALARSLSLEPEILLYDESIQTLDELPRSNIIGLIAELHKVMALTVVFATNDIKLIKTLCNKAVYIRNGTVRLSGNIEDVFYDLAGIYDWGKEHCTNLKNIQGCIASFVFRGSDLQTKSFLANLYGCMTVNRIIKADTCRVGKILISTLTVDTNVDSLQSVLAFMKGFTFHYSVLGGS